MSARALPVARRDIARLGAMGLAGLLAAGSLGAPVGARGAQQAVFRSNVDGVSVNVSVRSGGRPVLNLSAADFELTDNGVPQAIAAVTMESLPIDVTLLLDTSGSVEGRRLERLKQAVGETSSLLRPTDRLRLIAMQHALLQIFPFTPGGTKPPVEALTARGGTSLYDGLASALMGAHEPDRRQLIVVYTDGLDTISVLPPATVQSVAGIADAVVQFIVPDAGRTRAAATSTMIDLAARTGGHLFRVELDAPIADTFAAVVEEFRTSYVLRYMPTGVTRGGWHELAVRVKSGTYDVRARRGYEG